LNFAVLADPFGLARMSLTTLDRMFVPVVWEVALRFVCTPTGTKPKTAIKQRAATPKARVNSTREKAAIERLRSFIVDKFLRYHRSHSPGSRRDYLTLG
jgi:hypothetical protein